jgi:hypothetical protein
LNQRLGQVAERLVELGESDAFNQAIFDRIPPHRVFQGILLVLSLLGLVYVAYRLGIKSRHRLEPGLPRLESALYQHAPEGAVLEQRQEALLASGNLWEAARDMARQSLAAVGYLELEPAGGPPRVEASGGWWARRRLASSVKRLWLLAVSQEPVPVSPADCRRLAQDADNLNDAASHGAVRLTGTSTGARG